MMNLDTNTAAVLPFPVAPKKPKRAKRTSNITEKECTTRVTERQKYYDRGRGSVAGLYADISPTNHPAMFWVRCTTNAGEEKPIKIGRFHPTELNVVRARQIATDYKAQVSHGRDIAKEHKVARSAVRNAITVVQLVEMRIAYMKQEVPRKSDDKLEARFRNWPNVERHLKTYVSPTLGRKMIDQVTAEDIIEIEEAIQNGTLMLYDDKGRAIGPCTASKSNRRHVRSAVSAMFKWAKKEKRLIKENPCVEMPSLDREPSKDRVLTDDEIRTFWHGLDRPDMPWDRRICLGLKFALATMLRSWELLGAPKTELAVHDDGTDCIDVAADRVKKKRVVNQPLTGLALEIIKESMGNYDYLFAGRWGDAPLHRSAMANALRGTWRIVDAKKVTKSKGICEMLGLAPFTPHDLRRTAATLAGRTIITKDGVVLPAFGDAVIAHALDHQKESNSSTGIYNRAERKHMAEKRAVLESVEAKLLQIIGLSVSEQQLAA